MKISIPEPCSEDWSKMTPTEQGAFCQKCALEVTDFTDKSSLEIKSILTKKNQSKQRVCGHIENRQMIEFNNEFIPWTSDRESFRAIWMFSLVAVFGMTLFSCQSTFSKEIVEKMNTTSEVIIEEEKDTLDIGKLNYSISEMTSPDNLLELISNPWTPYDSDIIATGGPVVIHNVINWEPITCTQWLGNLIVSGGMVGDDQIPESKAPMNFAEFYVDPMESITPAPQTQSPRANDRNQQNSQRIEAKIEKGRPEFTAYISPIPIDNTSKLYVTIPEEGTLRLSIWELASMSEIHSETFDLIFGNHSVDINFHEFPKGKYASQLIWKEEKVIVPFEVLDKEIS